MHLSQSEELRTSLSKYFFANDNYFIFKKEKFAVRDFERAKIRLLQEIKKRHPELVKEIISAESELGIRKGDQFNQSQTEVNKSNLEK